MPPLQTPKKLNGGQVRSERYCKLYNTGVLPLHYNERRENPEASAPGTSIKTRKRDEDFLMHTSIHSKANAVIMSMIMATTMIPFSALASGCTAENSLNILRSSKGESTLLSSKHTSKADRDNYGIVQDIDGNRYATVLYLIEPGKTSFSASDAKDFLSKNNINYYQMIASSSMGTGNQEYAYLYFPESVTFTQLSQAKDILSQSYDVSFLTPDEYQEYADEANSSNVNIYQNETTYFGPASL